MSNALGMAFGDAIGGAMASFRNDRTRQDLLNKDREQREHERRVEQVRQAVAQMEAASREHVAQTGAQSRGYVADVGNEGRHYAADLAAGSADDRTDAMRYGADVSGRTRLGAAQIGANARSASDANAVTVQNLRNKGSLAATGLRNAGTLAAATARGTRPGADPNAARERSLTSLYGRMFGPRAQQFDAAGNPVPQQAPPDLQTWMKTQGFDRNAPAPGTGAPGPAGGAKPTYAPQHQQAASQMLQQIRQAEASGDVEKVKALKTQAAQFLSTIQPGAGGAPPPQQDDQFDDGADDEPDDDEDDSQP